MSFASAMTGTAERVPLPDLPIRVEITRLCSRTARRLASGNCESDTAIARAMVTRAIEGLCAFVHLALLLPAGGKPERGSRRPNEIGL